MTLQEEAPSQAPNPIDRRAEAMDASGMSSFLIRGILSDQLEIEGVPQSTSRTSTPKSRRPTRPPKYETTDRDVEIARSLHGVEIEEGYVPDSTGSGIEEAREMARRIGNRGALRRALESPRRSAREYPAVLAGHEARHTKAVEKPFLHS